MTTYKSYFFIAVYIFLSSGLYAQEFKFSLSSSAKQIKIGDFDGPLTIEGYSGKEIIVKGERCITEEDYENGIRVIGLNGLKDNTHGYCMNIQELDGVVHINSVLQNGRDILLLIPENMYLSVLSKNNRAHLLKVSNYKGEIEINSAYAEVELKNVSGAAIVNASYNNIKIDFTRLSTIKPSSIISTYNDIDITLPENMKADLHVKGDIFTNINGIAISKQQNQGNDLKAKSEIEIKLNGGGPHLYVRSDYGKIYLRKK